MTTPGFPPNTLDAEGVPLWISGLANEDPNHCVHVVKGLGPADALRTLGAEPRLVRPCTLPERRSDARMSLPAAALGAERGDDATLLAGQFGEWTFVYDDFGATEDPAGLSAAGRVAATSYFSINADASLTYCADGEQLSWINVDDLELDTDLAELPDELRAAFEAAGIVHFDYLEPGAADFAVCMRAVSALAGMRCTLDELRRIPLLVTSFG
ncbi:hypothetical protein F5X71_20420 [Nocardia brasiliensis]|uniref:Uncharacterized protein n=1 Tax=Nocardia brasiliensis TaxID=37326 RepID=A0A6G9XTW9_NOCBR|nr:DUF6461 domain-containing protein [Nocardia brasiliensis]QIS04374.1 hypothetical protein F5X71_20420 [Nocardia brasiliensis]